MCCCVCVYRRQERKNHVQITWDSPKTSAQLCLLFLIIRNRSDYDDDIPKRNGSSYVTRWFISERHSFTYQLKESVSWKNLRHDPTRYHVTGSSSRSTLLLSERVTASRHFGPSSFLPSSSLSDLVSTRLCSSSHVWITLLQHIYTFFNCLTWPRFNAFMLLSLWLLNILWSFKYLIPSYWRRDAPVLDLLRLSRRLNHNNTITSSTLQVW